MLFVDIWGPLLFSDDVDQIHFAVMYDKPHPDLNIYCLKAFAAIGSQDSLLFAYLKVY